jgi:hypothetical protein
MSMLTLNGVVQNVFRTSPSTDKKTGEVIPAADRVQIMAENTLPNGEKRIELVTLKVDQGDFYRSRQGRSVRVPVGVFANGSSVQFYALKGAMATEDGDARASVASTAGA